MNRWDEALKDFDRVEISRPNDAWTLKNRGKKTNTNKQTIINN